MNILTRLNTCAFLLSKQKRKSFLYKIVTGDEKWIYFDNSSNKKQWLDPSQTASHVPRPEIHQKKVMLCVWWDTKGIIYHEVLEERQTVNASLYSDQLIRLGHAIEEKGHILQKSLKVPLKTWTGKCYPTRRIHQTWLHQIITYSDQCSTSSVTSASLMSLW